MGPTSEGGSTCGARLWLARAALIQCTEGEGTPACVAAKNDNPCYHCTVARAPPQSPEQLFCHVSTAAPAGSFPSRIDLPNKSLKKIRGPRTTMLNNVSTNSNRRIASKHKAGKKKYRARVFSRSFEFHMHARTWTSQDFKNAISLTACTTTKNNAAAQQSL